MRKAILTFLAASLMALPVLVSAQVPTYSYTADAGMTMFTLQSAKATATSAAVRSPLQSSYGYLNVTMVGITGSPSGCAFAEAFQANNSTTVGSTQATVAFTPSNGVQSLLLAPTVLAADQIVITYSCSTYPTAGTISVTMSPVDSFVATQSIAGDPCKNPNVQTSSVVINISSTGTTQLVAPVAGKAVYVCQVTASGGSAATATLEYGTGSNCGTGTTTLTGALALNATQPVSMGWGGAVVTAPAGNALCLLAGGTVTTAQGVLSYVQQ